MNDVGALPGGDQRRTAPRRAGERIPGERTPGDRGRPVDLAVTRRRPGRSFRSLSRRIRFGELVDGRWYVELMWQPYECRAYATRQQAVAVVRQLQERFARLWEAS